MQRHRAVTNSSGPKENLASVWKPSNGRFDDGIVSIHPEIKPDAEEAELEKYGPYLRSLMDKAGLSVRDMEVDTCIDCGCEHDRRVRRCKECNKKHLAKGFTVRQ
jgi:hypothetical protein